MDVYTMEQWRADGSFSAEPGQEIAADVYEEMLNCMPPGTLPRETARKALREYKIPVHAGFLMGEPHSSDKHGQYYLAFGMSDYGRDKHYYYLGQSLPVRKTPDGFYYYMDCMSADVNDRLHPAAEFDGDADAIQAAANYEATLYKYEYRNGERISSRILYEPQFY